MNTDSKNRNSGQLRLTVSRAEGVLVRVLGVVVRRGFEPIEVLARVVSAAAGKESPDVVVVELRVESLYPIAGLAAHLGKLLDVRRVEVLSPPPDLRSRDPVPVTAGLSSPPV